MKRKEIIGLEGVPEIKQGDDLAALIHHSALQQGVILQDEDIIVVSQKIVSKAEGRIVDLSSVKPTLQALKIARLSGRDPRYVELALRESKSIVKQIKGHLITETIQGWIYSYSGVDLSNVSGGTAATLLPHDPDRSAQRIREGLEKLSGKRLGVVVSDTCGRPFRRGDINVAIGVSGFKPVLDLRGKRDIFGYRLRLKKVAVADEIASAAELVMGELNERIPVAIVRGVDVELDAYANSEPLKKRKEHDIFLKETWRVKPLHQADL
jgi:coenzyme F420-0:L-glutamate ligase/coenzyme F420-1:gamma-L-glutamate ligase